MITYVEYDADGNLVSIVEIYTAEGREVEQLQPGLTAEQKADRAKRLADAIDAREAETRAQLAQAKSPNAGLIVLPKNAATPTHDGHKVDVATGKVRARTAVERKAWADAHRPPDPTS